MDLIVPPRIPAEQTARAQELAVRAFVASRLRGHGPGRLFVRDDGEVLVNELNTIPGFTATSVYAKLFEASGISYAELLAGWSSSRSSATSAARAAVLTDGRSRRSAGRTCPAPSTGPAAAPVPERPIGPAVAAGSRLRPDVGLVRPPRSPRPRRRAPRRARRRRSRAERGRGCSCRGCRPSAAAGPRASRSLDDRVASAGCRLLRLAIGAPARSPASRRGHERRRRPGSARATLHAGSGSPHRAPRPARRAAPPRSASSTASPAAQATGLPGKVPPIALSRRRVHELGPPEHARRAAGRRRSTSPRSSGPARRRSAPSRTAGPCGRTRSAPRRPRGRCRARRRSRRSPRTNSTGGTTKPPSPCTGSKTIAATSSAATRSVSARSSSASAAAASGPRYGVRERHAVDLGRERPEPGLVGVRLRRQAHRHQRAAVERRRRRRSPPAARVERAILTAFSTASAPELKNAARTCPEIGASATRRSASAT